MKAIFVMFLIIYNRKLCAILALFLFSGCMPYYQNYHEPSSDSGQVISPRCGGPDVLLKVAHGNIIVSLNILTSSTVGYPNLLDIRLWSSDGSKFKVDITGVEMEFYDASGNPLQGSIISGDPKIFGLSGDMHDISNFVVISYKLMFYDEFSVVIKDIKVDDVFVDDINVRFRPKRGWFLSPLNC